MPNASASKRLKTLSLPLPYHEFYYVSFHVTNPAPSYCYAEVVFGFAVNTYPLLARKPLSGTLGIENIVGIAVGSYGSLAGGEGNPFSWPTSYLDIQKSNNFGATEVTINAGLLEDFAAATVTLVSLHLVLVDPSASNVTTQIVTPSPNAYAPAQADISGTLFEGGVTGTWANKNRWSSFVPFPATQPSSGEFSK